MALLVVDDYSLVYNSVDLSDHLLELDVPAEVAAVVSTTMGADTEHSIPGLKSSKITAKFAQDYAAAKVDVTMWAAYNARTAYTLVLKPTSSAVGATNPSYTATCYVQSYNPLGGKVGDLAVATVVFEISSGDLVRATS